MPAFTTLSRGSEWHRWDLHVHSPLSGLNNQFPWVSSAEPDWEKYLLALEALGDVDAIGITDYFTIEGYRKILEFRGQSRLQNLASILPNIEFRLDKFVGTSKGQRRLNYHVVFSEELSPQEIEEHFLQELKFYFEGDPQREDLRLTVKRSNLEFLGQRLKQEHSHFNDGRSDFEIGCMNATVDSGKIKEVLKNADSIFRGKYLVILAEDNTTDMEWDGQDHLTRKVLLQGADAIFSGNPKTAVWAAGKGGVPVDKFRAEFKSLKPCLHGSDAHRLQDIGQPANKRYCWIKAVPTFEGLKQVLYEPSERVFIGEAPPQLKQGYHVIKSVKIGSAPSWFDPVEIPINSDLVAIIGPRGSGKSALAEIVAFVGGASLFRPSPPGVRSARENIQDTFLAKASRKSRANQNPISGATITLHWCDGTTDSAVISETVRHDRDEEKVKFLPQMFVERLCAPENVEQLEEEIERVIFGRIAKTERLEASSFQELREASTQAIEVKRQKLGETLHSLNRSIAETQARIALKSVKESELGRKREELKALLKNTPQLPLENKQDLDRLDALAKRKEDLEGQVLRQSQQLRTIETIRTKLDTMAQDIRKFNADLVALLRQVGLEGEVAKFEVHMPAEAGQIVARRRQELSDAIALLRKGAGEPSDPLASLEGVERQIVEIRAKLQLTEAKRKEYEKFQKDRSTLADVISALERDVKEIVDTLIPQLKQDDDTRTERYLDYFELLKEERTVLEALYQPLKESLAAANETANKLAFVARITCDVSRHAQLGTELLDRRRALYNEPEQLEEALRRSFEEIEATGFDRDKSRVALQRFRQSFLSQGGKTLRIEEQLRKDKTPKDFADWFYSLDHFAVTYSVTFDDKELRLLSPGEKGVVLLLLYLEAESQDDRPLIIDQPDDNLDNLSVYPTLVEYFRTRKKTRQVIIITHNPNLVVNTDAEQIFVAAFDGAQTPKISYRAGPLEDTNLAGPVHGIREEVCAVLEGGMEAFQLREQRYSLS